ncbi:MAG: hypothetical protein V8Q36_03175 [Anaerotignum sp.]
MPGISDRAYLVKLCYEAGVPVTVSPGASAAVVALGLSGLDTRRFVFEGFSPTGEKRSAGGSFDIGKATPHHEFL